MTDSRHRPQFQSDRLTDPAAFIGALLADPEFRRELEEEDRRKWETFMRRLLAWDGESEELPHARNTLIAALRCDLNRWWLTTIRRRRSSQAPCTVIDWHPGIDS